MNVYSAFWRTVRSRPFEAIGALYWHLTGRKVRARNRLRVSVAQSPHAYRVWIENIESGPKLLASASAEMASWRHQPTFTVVVYLTADRDTAATLAMLRSQLYPHWDVIFICQTGATVTLDDSPQIRVADRVAMDESEAMRIAAPLAEGDFLLTLPHDTHLPPASLFRYAEALQSFPNAKMLFGDNDWLDAQGRRYRPWFKPEWNRELALAQDYLTQSMVIARDTMRKLIDEAVCGASPTPYACALAVGEIHPSEIRHVPHIQSHINGTELANGMQDQVAVVQAHLENFSSGAVASMTPHATIRVDWPLPKPLPLVSIVIPTRDKVSLLRPCVDSLIEFTQYSPFEVLIVDNGSKQASTLKYLEQVARHPAVRVIRDERPYNFSQLNNRAAAEAHGSYLCLLNNDTKIADGEWLTVMMRHAVRSEVGAVGARLLYADGSIQHAGVVVGLGGAAGHAHRFLNSEASGYFDRTHATHYVSAVTAACLVVSKNKYLAVGGFDEQSFAVAFNDVDFCLKLQNAGWRNIYTPYATLYHYESKSRGKDSSPAHISRYLKELHNLQIRWGTKEHIDPLHHINLDNSSENYLIKL